MQSGKGGWFVIFRLLEVHFVFCQLNFIVLFPFLKKYYHIMFINIVFWLGCDRPSGLLLFLPALLPSKLTPLVLPCSNVSLSYFILAVPMRECLGKNSCTSSPFPIAILNATSFFSLFGARETKHAQRSGRYYRLCYKLQFKPFNKKKMQEDFRRKNEIGNKCPTKKNCFFVFSI